MQRLSITIEDQLKTELDHIAGKGERAAFISRAIQKAVDDWHRQQALKESWISSRIKSIRIQSKSCGKSEKDVYIKCCKPARNSHATLCHR